MTASDAKVEDVDERVDAIETAFVAHWSNFGRWPGASLREDHGVLMYETPIAHLPYQAVIRTQIPDGDDADLVIARVTDGFRAREVPFMWVVRPSDRPANLAHRLPAQGLDLVEQATGMDLDLGAPIASPDVGTDLRIVEADTPETLRDYEFLIRTYWSVPEAEREMIERLNRHWTGARSPGVRLVAYVDDAIAGKLFMNTTEMPKVAIYGVAVRPDARGRGLATALMTEALHRAHAVGATRAVLHSSAMALSLYRRMGFVERCTFDVYATAPLFGTHHH
jgi:ribosomal protein S18 acetylase RimI-like enzyme